MLMIIIESQPVYESRFAVMVQVFHSCGHVHCNLKQFKERKCNSSEKKRHMRHYRK